MDLKNLMNDGPVPEKRASSSPELSRTNLPRAPPGLARTNRHPLRLGLGASSGSAQQTPMYAPPSSQAARSTSASMPPGKGLTPLHTPNQALYAGQYPFPQHALSQSPTAGQQYPPAQQHQSQSNAVGSYSAMTPGGGSVGRPPSQSYQHQHPSTPSHYGPTSGIPPAFHAQPTSSHSPTPSSHHGQSTPHSARQSPHLVLHTQPPLHNPYSQPSTPLGPPLHPPQRSLPSQQFDFTSPIHSRTFSGASNGLPMPSQSPHGMNHISIGSMNESPGAYYRPSPHVRQSSGYMSVEREKSESVSPKTKVPPRPPSLGSRHSSQQEVYSLNARSTLKGPTTSSPVAQDHVQALPAPPQANHQSVAKPQQLPYGANTAIGVTQQAPLLAQTSDPSAEPDSLSLSQHASAQPSPGSEIGGVLQHHSSQRMDMRSLLTPVDEQPPASEAGAVNGGRMATGPHPPKRAPADPFAKPSPRPKQPAFVTAPPSQQQQQQQQPPMQEIKQEVRPALIEIPAVNERKRPAETDQPAGQEPPVKRERRRKYYDRPVWAKLSVHNPRYSAQANGTNGSLHAPGAQQPQHPQKGEQPRPSPQPPRQQQQQQQPQPNGAPPVQRPQPSHPNGLPPHADGPPWLQDPPLDGDLIHARRLLGPWEKTFQWHTPMPSLLRQVYNWLYTNLAANRDLGLEAGLGGIEIEAKIGTLVGVSGAGEGERLRLPVVSACVLAEGVGVRFESQMVESEHKTMNEFLNHTIRESQQPGRVPMSYSHRYETDSFAPLSALGYSMLPTNLTTKRPIGRSIKMRTSRNDKTGQILGRIVKIPIAPDLHIYNPGEAYDCRISMNLEVNLDRPGIEPEDLVELAPAQEGGDGKRAPPPQPDRKKDRLSYKHLAYSIDLTKVEVRGLAPKYELELEVDSGLLREQMARLEKGEEEAFGDVASGLLDDAVFLMRQRPNAG